MTMFETVCTKCDAEVKIEEEYRNSDNYYLCGWCAMAKGGY